MSRNRLVIGGTIFFLLLVGVVIALAGRSSLNTAQPVADNAGSAAQAPVDGPRTGLAQSSDKVRLKVAGDPSRALENDEILVTLDMDPGWHVNANPASMEFLIPTAASAAANGEPVDIPIQYPPGRVSDITLGDTAIEVYDDGANIRVIPTEEAKEAGVVELKVRVQACSDEGVCLAPSDLSVTLKDAESKGT